MQCAPLMHRALGTSATGGTIRFSLGAFNTPKQIDLAIQAVGEIASTA
jgi:selenocysteine lyase/cysteine desulfurase